MDPCKTKLISLDGTETEFCIPDLKHGEPFPRVLIKSGKISAGIPSTVYIIDDKEVRNRYFTVMVYRETSALYI